MRIAALLLFFAGSAFAQYSGPAVDACLGYAKREAAREGTRAKDIVFERDQNLSIERYTRKLGSQFVASILTGNGAVVYDGAPSAELSFICLLASDKQGVSNIPTTINFFIIGIGPWTGREHGSGRTGSR